MIEGAFTGEKIPMKNHPMGLGINCSCLRDETLKDVIPWVYPPPRIPVANEGLGPIKNVIFLVVTGILGGG